MAGPVGVLGGVGDGVGVGAWRPLSWLCGAVAGRVAVLVLWPVSWPGVVSSILLSIVAGAGGVGVCRWSVRCPAWAGPPAVHGAGAGLCPPLRLGCLPGLLAALLAVDAGRDHVRGRSCCRWVLFPFGSLPQVHSRVSGGPRGLFGR